MNVLVLGPQGSGKGTQAKLASAEHDLPHVSTGDMFRALDDATPLGREINAIMERGDLVPDDVVLAMLRKPVTEAAAAGGYVLDGFPRTVEQAEAAYAVAKDLGVAVQVAVHLAVDSEALVERLIARGEATGRTDDTPEVIRHRIEVYEERTAPLLAYYAERERLVQVNGDRPIDEVTWSVVVQLQKAQRLLAD